MRWWLHAGINVERRHCRDYWPVRFELESSELQANGLTLLGGRGTLTLYGGAALERLPWQPEPGEADGYARRDPS